MNNNHLITGVQGSGKTTLRDKFKQKGYQTIDIDDGYAHWVEKSTGRVVPHNPGGGMEWLMSVDFLLDLSKFTALLREPRQDPLLVFGGTGDLLEHLDYFDYIYLLEYPDESSVINRLSERTNNLYGKHPDEVRSVLRYMGPYQDKLKARGAFAIDCTQPLSKVVEAIEYGINQYK